MCDDFRILRCTSNTIRPPLTHNFNAKVIFFTFFYIGFLLCCVCVFLFIATRQDFVVVAKGPHNTFRIELAPKCPLGEGFETTNYSRYVWSEIICFHAKIARVSLFQCSHFTLPPMKPIHSFKPTFIPLCYVTKLYRVKRHNAKYVSIYHTHRYCFSNWLIHLVSCTSIVP